MAFDIVEFGKVVRNLDSKRIPLSSRERAERQGSVPYYGAAGIIDYVNAAIFKGLHLLIGEDGSVVRNDGTPYLQLADGEFWVNNHAHVVRAERDSDTRYIYYALQKANIAGLVTGAVQLKLTQSNLNKIPIPFPEQATRDEIVRILGSLDDKIELNRRMAATLEEMARAIFKSWFIDFDPVRAKSEGRPTGLPPDINALFPDEFEESELGLIPRGWKIGKLGDITRNLRRSVSVNNISPEEPYVGLDAIPKRSLALMNWGKGEQVESQKSRFKNGEILFGKLRPYFHKVCIAPVEGVCSTDILVLDSKEESWYPVVALKLSEVSTIEFVTAAADGTRMPRTKWEDLDRMPIVIPPIELVKRFDHHMRPFLVRIQRVSLECQSLEAIRDTLLPKLMSGQLLGDLKNE